MDGEISSGSVIPSFNASVPMLLSARNLGDRKSTNDCSRIQGLARFAQMTDRQTYHDLWQYPRKDPRKALGKDSKTDSGWGQF